MRNVRKTRSHAQRKSSKLYEGMNLTRKRLTFSMTFASIWFDTFYAVVCLFPRLNFHWWKCWKMVLDAFYLSKKRHRTSYEGRRKWLYKMFLTSALLRRYHTTSKLFSPAKWKTSHYRQTFHCMKKLRNSFKHSQNQGTQSQLKTLYIPFCNQSELWRCFLNMRQCAVLERNLRIEQPTTCSNFENILRQRNEKRCITNYIQNPNLKSN